MSDDSRDDLSETSAEDDFRDNLSETAQQDIDALANASLEHATELLDANDGFMPFAVTLNPDDELQVLEVEVPDGVEATGEDILNSIVAGLAEQRAGLRGAAVVSDVAIQEMATDAVQVMIEIAEGPSAIGVLLPYRIVENERTYEDPMAGPGEVAIWADGAGDDEPPAPTVDDAARIF